MMHKTFGFIGIALIAVSLTTQAFAEKQKPFNRVVVIIDSSGTFANHQFKAIQKVNKLLAQMASKKEKRYEAQDQVYIISLDAKPQIIWAGIRDQLLQLTQNELSELFKERRKYSYCTDIATAFNLAAYKLNRDPIPAAKWLFVFSDLIDEPAISGTKCKKPEYPSPPSEKIRWDRLIDTSIVVFWAQDGQIIEWEEALLDKKLSITFFDEAESLNTKILPPPKARKKMTDEERKEAKKRLIERGLFLLKWGKFLAVGSISLIIFTVFVVLVIRFASRRRHRTPVVNTQHERRR